ncbi:DUF4097 family beta strand repeat-containing protein [Deinococcus murrayi]|uniref:DUF4097 family beta strand repeat-containing protein n=1 Tax=Deinococcus murrayi TaxID=68910 RepID=UPI000488EEFA|nr:DUF4097 family beta strand repeat-containing protein [Deinococcus murrayi]
MSTPTRPPARPLSPVLARIALGLGLVAAGGALTWAGWRVTPAPGLNVRETPLSVPLAGATALGVQLAGDRTALGVAGLPWPGREALTGRATHRERNPLRVQTSREGGRLRVSVRLNVAPLGEGVVNLNPHPVPHRLDVQLSRGVPLRLEAGTASGELRLDLHALQVRELTARTHSGALTATLPALESGPLTLATASGAVTLRAPAAWRAPTLSVSTGSGPVTLRLGEARARRLTVSTQSGDVTGELPRGEAGTVTSTSGDLALRLPDGAAGTLTLRTTSGEVRLSLPPDTSARVRLVGGEWLDPPGDLLRRGNVAATDPAALTDPDLDLRVEAPRLRLVRRLPEEGDIP